MSAPAFARRAIAALVALPAVAAAQTVQGIIVDRSDHPVAGVVVLLLDNTANTAARALSNVRGEYRLAAPTAGTYRLRSTRIGFRPNTSEPFAIGATDEVTRRLVLADIPLALDTVRVAGRPPCRLVADSAAATYMAWEQVRTALTAAQLTDSSGIAATTVTYERTLDPSAKRIWKQTSAISSQFVRQPWESMSPDRLHRNGYVSVAGDWTTYFAPGIDALLSESFVEDHCIRLVASTNDPAKLGLGFEPTAERRRIPEIRGTLWLDRASSELRSLEFAYLNVPRAQQDQAGGAMEFARMRDGEWTVSRWNIRMPVLLLGLSSGSESRVAEVRVAGGELSLVRRGADTIWAIPPVVLAGIVTDSASGLPVANARVALHGTGLVGVTDGSGRFDVAGVLPGEYVLDVRTPSFDSVGTVAQSVLAFTDSAKLYQVRLPSAQQVVAGICGNRRFDHPGIIVGSAMVRGEIAPPSGASIVAEWRDESPSGGRSHILETRTDSSGAFRLCDVPLNSALTVTVRGENAAGSATDVRIPSERRIAHVDLTLDRALAATARFIGFVLSDSAQQPLAEAEVTLPGLAKRALTNERGAFELTEIPAGEQQIVVRRLGYGVIDTTLAFAANATVQRKILLRRSSRLDAVVVLGAGNLPSTFDEHRKLGLGAFMTREELAKQQGRRMSEVISQIQGAGLVAGARGNAYLLSARGGSARIPSCLGGVPLPKDVPSQLSTGIGQAKVCEMSTAAAGTGIYCPETAEEKMRGVLCGCYAQVYMDRTLLNRQQSTIVDGKLVRATPPFDLNSFALDQLEAIEYFRSAAETPGMYAALDASNCGVLVLWTRRSH